MDVHNIADNPLASYLQSKAKTAHVNPDDLAVAGFNALTQKQGILGKVGAGYCMTEQPQLYTYSAAGGAGLGVLVTLVVVYIVRTLSSVFRRKEKIVYVTNNTVAPQANSISDPVVIAPPSA